MNRGQVAAVAAVFALLAGLSAWLQLGVLARAPAAITGADDAPDVIISNFTATGVDEFGAAYRLRAARLTHYPRAGHALLERPRIVQYGAGDGGDGDSRARDIEADAGILDDAEREVKLTGNVRVREGASVATVNTMTVNLGRER